MDIIFLKKINTKKHFFNIIEIFSYLKNKKTFFKVAKSLYYKKTWIFDCIE